MKTPSSARLGADAASLFSDSGLRGSGSSGSARANNSSTSNNNSNISSSNSKLLEKLQQSSSFVRKKVETIRKKTKAVDSWVGPKLKDLWRASCCSSARLLQQVDGYQPSQRAAEAALAAYQRRSSTRSSDDVAFQGMDYTLYTINEVDCPGDSEVVIARLRSLAAGMKSNKVDSPNLEAPELDVKELDVGEFSMITPTMELKPEVGYHSMMLQCHQLSASSSTKAYTIRFHPTTYLL